MQSIQTFKKFFESFIMMGMDLITEQESELYTDEE